MDRADELGPQLPAQRPHVRVDGSAGGAVPVPPELGQESVSGEDHFGPCGEEGEEVELRRREMDGVPSKGRTPCGGVDLQIYRGLYGTVQGRYTKAAGKLASDFIDFDPIDLSGFRLSAGINVLF